MLKELAHDLISSFKKRGISKIEMISIIDTVYNSNLLRDSEESIEKKEESNSETPKKMNLDLTSSEADLYEIFTDGAARGNPGPAGGGVVIKHNDLVIGEYYFYFEEMTNNCAEYMALIEALKIAEQNNIMNIRLYSDSQLIVNQLNGIYRVKNEKLKEYYSEAVRILKKLKNYEIIHVKRGKNKEADNLANLGIDKKKQGKRSG